MARLAGPAIRLYLFLRPVLRPFRGWGWAQKKDTPTIRRAIQNTSLTRQHAPYQS